MNSWVRPQGIQHQLRGVRFDAMHSSVWLGLIMDTVKLHNAEVVVGPYVCFAHYTAWHDVLGGIRPPLAALLSYM